MKYTFGRHLLSYCSMLDIVLWTPDTKIKGPSSLVGKVALGTCPCRIRTRTNNSRRFEEDFREVVMLELGLEIVSKSSSD